MPRKSSEPKTTNFTTFEVHLNWLCECGSLNKSEAPVREDEDDEDGGSVFDMPADPVACKNCGQHYWLTRPDEPDEDEDVTPDEFFDLVDEDTDKGVDFEPDEDD